MPIILNTNPYQQYKEQGVMTAGPMELVIKLYDGAVKQMKLAQMYLGDKKPDSAEKANKALILAQDILTELIAGLKFNYQIADTLFSYYVLISRELATANVKKDPSKIEPLIEIMLELRDAWVTINKMEKVTAPELTYTTGKAAEDE